MANLSSFYPQPVVPNAIEVTASGSNTARPLSDRFGETVKVADFGAKGDGVADDAAAIQEAITYAISRGNAVIEFEPKTYRLTANASITGGASFPFVNRRHLEVYGGTSSTKLLFLGNGAKLYTDQNDSNNLSYFVMVTSELFSIEFYDLTFERGPQTRGQNGNSPFAGDAFIAMRPVSTQPIDHVTCNNVTFINGFSAHINNAAYSTSKTFRKLRLVEWINCRHLHPRGCGSTQTGGGGQMLNLSGWVDTLMADGVYADGAVGGTIPNDVTFPVDGWLFSNPYHTIVTNSHFRNMWVEGIFCSGPFWTLIDLLPFVQPEVDDQVTVTAASSQINFNEELVQGKLYTIRDWNIAPPFWRSAASGVYRVDSAPSPIVGNSQIVLTRMADSLIHPIDTARPELQEGVAAGQTIGYGRINLFEVAGDASASIDNCTFVVRKSITRQNGTSHLYPELQITNGGSGYSSAPTVTISGNGTAIATATITNGSVTRISLNAGAHYYATLPTVTITGGGGQGATAVAEFREMRMLPAIIAMCPTKITNCYFDCGCSIWMNPTGEFTRSGFSVSANNTIYSRPSPNGFHQESTINQCLSPNSIIVNNSFISETATIAPLYAGRHGVNISNNIFYSITPAGAGQSTRAIDVAYSEGNASAEWQMHIDNNYFYGFNYGLFGLSPCLIGQMRGTFVTAPWSLVYQTKGSRLFMRSPDGAPCQLSVTNDGELEVIK